MKLFFTVLFTILSAQTWACSCSDDAWPLDQEESVIRVATDAANLGRASSVLEDGITMIKSYPTLRERLNIYDYKGSSCEVFGPNNESHFLCEGTSKAKYEVVVTGRKGKCVVLVKAKSTTRTVRARALGKTCHYL